MSRAVTPTLADLISSAVTAGIAAIHVSMPASVEEYDGERQSISARPLIQRGYVDEAGHRQVEELPIITDVPIVFPGSGGFRVTFPVAKGDTVLLLFSESSLDKWLHGGGLVDPEDDRRNCLTDAIAIPGLRSFNRALKNAPSDAMSAGYDEGATVSLHKDEIRIGSPSAADPVSLHSDLVSLKNALDSWTPVAMDGGAALKAILTTLISTGWPFGAQKVKVE